MNNLSLRVLTALFLLPLVLVAIFSGGWVLESLLIIIALASIYETVSIIYPQSPHSNFFVVTIFLGASPFILGLNLVLSGLILFMSILALLMFLLFTDSNDQNLEKIGAIFLVSFYVSLALSSINWTFDMLPEGKFFILLACVCTWLNDSLAYFGGKLFGKTPLFLSVSQKKTWEGFFCGATFSVLFVCAFFMLDSYLLKINLLKIRFIDVLFLSIPISILAPLGDLIESKIKRMYNVKDSSSILPGHGGMLDRIDGLLIALPWACFYAYIRNHI